MASNLHSAILGASALPTATRILALVHFVVFAVAVVVMAIVMVVVISVVVAAVVIAVWMDIA